VFLIEHNKIKVTNSKNLRQGIKILVHSVEDFRNLIKILDHGAFEYYTYQLPEEKELKVVVRGVFEELKTESIINDLRSRGFHPTEVVRMRSYRNNRKILPLVLVKLPQNEGNIYNLKNIGYLSVSVEPLKKSNRTGQCFRCQLFGHNEKFCTSKFRCVKCGESHDSRSCTKPKESKPTCANCKGEHPASYRGCVFYPKKNAPIIRKVNAPNMKFTNPIKLGLIYLSYAQMAAECSSASASKTSNKFDTKNVEHLLASLTQTLSTQIATIIGELFRTINNNNNNNSCLS